MFIKIAVLSAFKVNMDYVGIAGWPEGNRRFYFNLFKVDHQPEILENLEKRIAIQEITQGLTFKKVC